MDLFYIILALIIGYLIGGDRLIKDQEDDNADDEF